MLEVEKSNGVEASFQVLVDVLTDKGVGYDELIISIQG